MKLIIDFNNGEQLTYVLKDTSVVSNWASMLQTLSADNVSLIASQHNSNHGFSSPIQFFEKYNELVALGRKYKILLPSELTVDNWHDVLNQAHTHFPEWKRKTAICNIDAHSFNLLIHWLEYEAANIFDGRREYIINTDFNHNPALYAKYLTAFDDSDYAEFTPVLEFGSIHLHYVHIGRHFLELANALDLVAPPRHFVPQTKYCGTFGLVFSEPSTRDYNLLQEYYNERGGKSWFGMEFNNPRMAIGFYRLGTLINVAEYSTVASRNDLRNRLSDAAIVKWTFTQ